MKVGQWINTGVKPFSANIMYQGRKVKSAAYRDHEAVLSRRLPDIPIPDGPLTLKILVCYSNSLSDLDNALKPFLDVLQKRYKFNDRNIYKIVARKRVVPKGEDTIKFSIEPFTEEVKRHGIE